MEALSPTMEEGRIASWLKHEGDAVKAGDVLAEVETDKAIMELQARGDGVLRKILVEQGVTAPVGSLVAVIADAGDDISNLVSAPSASSAPSPPPPHADKSGRGAEVEAGVRPSPSAAPAPSAAGGAAAGRIKASPLARRMAREQGVALASLTGTGPAGRIIKRDVESVIAATPAAPAPAAPGAVAVGGGWRDVVPTQLRKTIARRLVQSLGPVPHFYLTVEIDMERAAEAREALNALGDVRISFNDIIAKVTALALQQHPECNAWWQDGTIRYFDAVHLSMAVAIDDGLITPVIRDAHRKSLRAIAAESRELADRARARRLQPEEYTGGTFSISNLGMFGIDEFTAVINPPEAAILAVGAVTDKPVVVGGTVAVRKRMRVTLSCDHRVIDGATGARFLQTVTRMLENPLAMVW
jgi:pyruvate dehydrogenase E2 component (dihydrolipoamide acetyltransferase)